MPSKQKDKFTVYQEPIKL